MEQTERLGRVMMDEYSKELEESFERNYEAMCIAMPQFSGNTELKRMFRWFYMEGAVDVVMESANG